jgi:hypothetical protein
LTISRVFFNQERLVARQWQKKKGISFKDISIDPDQQKRESKNLLSYVPLFPGYYQLMRSYDVNGYLMSNYDDPKVQNKSFYGTLNKVLQFRKGIDYSKVVILLVDDNAIYDCAREGSLRFFSDIAIKSNSEEHVVGSKGDLIKLLEQNIEGRDISGEVDLLDDGEECVAVPLQIEAIIVDNKDVKSEVQRILDASTNSCEQPELFVDKLPRNDPGDWEFP